MAGMKGSYVRKLDGRSYWKFKWFSRKSDAVHAADLQKKRGFLARVIPEDGGHTVYTR